MIVGMARMEVTMDPMVMDLRATTERIKEMEVIMDLRTTTMTPSPMMDGLLGLIPLPTSMTLSSALATTSDLVVKLRTVKEATRSRSTASVVSLNMVLKVTRDTALVDMTGAVADAVREVEVALMTTDLFRSSTNFRF